MMHYEYEREYDHKKKKLLGIQHTDQALYCNES